MQAIGNGTSLEIRDARTPWAALLFLSATPILHFLFQYTLIFLLQGRWPNVIPVLLYGLPYWLFWVAVSAVLVRLAPRFPILGHRWRRGLLFHLGLSLAIVFLSLLFFPWWDGFLGPLGRPSLPWTKQLVQTVVGTSLMLENLLVFWSLAGTIHAVDYYHRFRHGELRAAHLEAQLSEARMQALQMQLQPHFLFNTLNSISTLVLDRHDGRAVEMITRLGDFLRTTLEGPAAPRIPLRQELDFVERYLAIEQVRFGPRLTVRLEVEAEALDVLVPNLLLQPLVENAVRHGIAPRRQGGTIHLRAGRRGDRLWLEVRDDGEGLPQDRSQGGERPGVGLNNVRQRLEQLYGSGHRFRMENHPEGGVRAVVEVPWQCA